MYDVQKIRSDFPILSREVNGKPLTYLDNGASAQKPQVVIDAVTNAYAHEYSNVHRGLHYLSNLATEKYESVRGTVARFLGVSNEDEIVLNSGTTEGINLVVYGWAMPRMEAGDEIVLSVMEHHENVVPWHFLRERQGVVLKWVDVDADGDVHGPVGDLGTADLDHDRVDQQHRIHRIQRPVLPRSHVSDDLVGDLRDRLTAHLGVIDLLKVRLDLACGETLGIQRDHIG